ncbi:amidohydrolase family protein [Nocardioides nematodiphilus]|uniref:amidohydrolase family protein n=1 Tax=Nocardioides nematodiphilus TaxID=2849669 RepID=UPI001CD92FE8|nr:amidohydrolase family protein [Nocardioides nematodiphilus]MCA1984191.1 amidohydrolase [Nocardioides nematodiphilus]
MTALDDLLPEAADVTAWWQRHGLPGLFDVHVHFMAPPVQRAVWEVFDSAGPKIGRPWPIRYRLPDDDRVALLRALGVRRFSALSYAHKPGVAAFLNDWSRAFAERVPESLWSATLYPEESVLGYVTELVAAGVEIFKVHVQVGEFLLDDPLLDPVWGLLAEAGTPVVIHVGSGPVGNEFTGPASLRRVLARHPRLTVIVAHLGAPEYADFLDLAERYDRVRLDTTMVFTDFFDEAGARFPAALLPRLRDLGDRVLLGTDYPTIPYPYLHQLTALEALDLGNEWLRAVCWDNGSSLFGPGR